MLPREGSGPARMCIEGDRGHFFLGPLKCPACGARGRLEDGGSFWLDEAHVRLDALGRPMIVTDSRELLWIDCARCDHHGELQTFEPPWFEPTGRRRLAPEDWSEGLPIGVAPMPLTLSDRRDEAQWAADEFVQAQSPSAPVVAANQV